MFRTYVIHIRTLYVHCCQLLGPGTNGTPYAPLSSKGVWAVIFALWVQLVRATVGATCGCNLFTLHFSASASHCSSHFFAATVIT